MWNYSEPLNRILKDFNLSFVEFEFGGEKYRVDVLENMKHLVFVNDNSVDNWMKIINESYNDLHLLTAIGKKARLVMKEKFDITQFAMGLIQG